LRGIIIAVVVVALFLLLVAWMKVAVTVVFRHAKDDDEYKIVVRTLFGLIRYTIRIPLIKLETESESPGVTFVHKEGVGGTRTKKEKKSKWTPRDIAHFFRQVKQFLKQVVDLHEIMKQFYRHVTITKWEWRTTIGTGDAASTGLIAGLGWSLKYTIIGVVSRYTKMKTVPVIMIVPSYDPSGFGNSVFMYVSVSNRACYVSRIASGQTLERTALAETKAACGQTGK